VPTPFFFMRSASRLRMASFDGIVHSACTAAAAGRGVLSRLLHLRAKSRVPLVHFFQSAIQHGARQVLAANDDAGDLAGVGHILQRIGIEEQQVGLFAHFDRASLVGDAEPFARQTSRPLEHLKVAQARTRERFQLVV
jgi:hypothetical protein